MSEKVIIESPKITTDTCGILFKKGEKTFVTAEQYEVLKNDRSYKALIKGRFLIEVSVRDITHANVVDEVKFDNKKNLKKQKEEFEAKIKNLRDLNIANLKGIKVSNDSKEASLRTIINELKAKIVELEKNLKTLKGLESKNNK